MSAWRDARNAKALARLSKAPTGSIPPVVLAHALSRPLIPPTPRLAVERYWRDHPLRADRLARALVRRAGPPPGWRWTVAERSFRAPPAPYRDPAFAPGPGRCCVCGEAVFRLGWHRDLWERGANLNASWHACCVAAWKLWCAPATHMRELKRAQRFRCAQDGARLRRTAEVDHRVPLFRVWRDHRDLPWAELLAFWGAPNLQVVNRAAHQGKTLDEAAERASRRARPEPPDAALLRSVADLLRTDGRP